jgi:Ca-activated chloride channel family protein
MNGRNVLVAAGALAAATIALRGQQGATLQITSPAKETVVTGPTRLEATVEPSSAIASIKQVTFTVNGKLACTVEKPPYACAWDPGDVIRGQHIRAVADLSDGNRLIGNVFTKDLGYTEQVRTDAVLVQAIVTHGGQFVRGLKQQDFEIVEDGAPQKIASFVSEDAPLDLVLAIDVSGSMEHALDDVKSAVKQLLSKLRPGDAATIIGFNDNMFLAAEREKDQQARERAVDLLTAWGGTSLYDATVRAIDLVSRDTGRKGIVIFSDGDDRNSITTREAATARVQASNAMLYTVGFGGGASVPTLKTKLEQYAHATGGRAFFPQRAQDLNSVFDEIVAELSNQYVLSYSSTNLKQDNSWRNIKVRVKSGKYDVRARDGYRARAVATQRSGR